MIFLVSWGILKELEMQDNQNYFIACFFLCVLIACYILGIGYILLQELQKHGVKHVVRVCDPTYNKEKLEKEGIEVLVC